MGVKSEAERHGGAVVRGLYGYVREDDGGRARWVRDPERVAVIRRIFAERSAGATYEGISAGLNRDRIPSPSGGLWVQSTIAELLRNPAYVGRPRGQSVARHSRREDEPIIDEAMYSRVQRLAASSTRARRKADDLGMLAPRIRIRRAELGLSQSEVARRAGITHSTVSRLESGVRRPEPQVLYALAAALQTSVLDLMRSTSGGDAEPDGPGTSPPAGPVHRELRDTLMALERGFPWLKPAERHLILAILKPLAERAEAARHRYLSP